MSPRPTHPHADRGAHPSPRGPHPATPARVVRTAATALAALVILSGCAGAPAPRFSGDGAPYFSLVHDRYAKCLGDFPAAAYTFNPGGIDPRQVGTVEVADSKNQLFWAVVTPVKKGDALLTVSDAGTAGRLKGAGC
ncbi:MAG: hypothetical protein J0I50_04740 [Microbacterium sp.]|nr:hypothetical protein [Microbacterium sp.]